MSRRGVMFQIDRVVDESRLRPRGSDARRDGFFSGTIPKSYGPEAATHRCGVGGRGCLGCIPHATEADSVVRQAGVVDRRVTGSIGGSATVGGGIPRTTANYPVGPFSGAPWILLRALSIIILGITIVAPFRHVSVHVEETPGIRLLLADRMRRFRGILRRPGIIAKHARIVAEAVLARSACPAGVFPLRFSGQAIAIGVEVALPRLLVVARLEALRHRPVVAIEGRIGPVDLLQRLVGAFEVGWVGKLVFTELILDHLMPVHPEGIDPYAVHGGLVVLPLLAAHLEPSFRDDHHLDTALGRSQFGFLGDLLFPLATQDGQDGCHDQKCSCSQFGGVSVHRLSFASDGSSRAICLLKRSAPSPAPCLGDRRW